MSDRARSNVFSIAAHRGFADALVAGLVPRYTDKDMGLARLTLILPSSRARRTVSEAFVRYYGAQGEAGMLMPRMAVIGDLDLDEALGPLLDPLGVEGISPAVDPTRRWLQLAQYIAEEMGDAAPTGAARLRLAREIAATMDRLLIEDIGPEQLLSDPVLDMLGDLSAHWQDSLRLFARIQTRWLSQLQVRDEVDTATRRNRLFDTTARSWRKQPPSTPIIAAGVTSAAPALARLLKTIAQLPQGAVILPDFDLAMDDGVWEELGDAGALGEARFASGDAVTHPQYHLKLLLNRMGVARGEVRPWHRKGMGAARSERSHAISNLFLPPESSKSWVGLPPEKRRLSGVRLMDCAHPEEEAQAIALLVREALEQPERRVAVVTPDRGLARRIVQHLRRWNIVADDSAGRPLSDTVAGRLLLLLAQVAAERAAPVALMALLEHPLAHCGEQRQAWLANVRALELALRGPRPAPGPEPLSAIAGSAQAGAWWDGVAGVLAPLLDAPDEAPLAQWLDILNQVGSALCGDALWAREDGRALSAFVEDLRFHARETAVLMPLDDLHSALRDAMEGAAVRPAWGGHPRIAIYGLLESRMTRADLVICGGLVEGVWPAAPATQPLLAPPVLRALGVPGADFRIGLAAHDLAGALGAPQVVLSASARDLSGPVVPSRFLLRVKALLGDRLVDAHSEDSAVKLAQALTRAVHEPPYSRPQPMPDAAQRKQRISVTALDRLRSDPYQFYAGQILQLKEIDALDAEPSPAWQGNAAHKILENWHKSGLPMAQLAHQELEKMNAHPLSRALWRPRLMEALAWIEQEIAGFEGRIPALFEEWGEMTVRGVEIFGKADRIDTMDGGALAIVDYKTGRPPSGKQVENGYALQLGTIGLMAQGGAFSGASAGTLVDLAGTPQAFEYWSLAKRKDGNGFGYIDTPVLSGRKRSGIAREDFLCEAQHYLDDALDRWILGDEPFTARLNPDAKVFTTYDQLMRLDEWQGREG